MKCVQSSYSPHQLEELASLIRKASGDLTVSRHELEIRLTDLMRAVGRPIANDEYAADFGNLGEGDLSHSDLSKRFQAIAIAGDPLDPDLCNGIVLTKLNHAARAKWARRFKTEGINRPHPIRGLRAEDLTAEELSDVKEMAAHLAQYHRSFVRREQPRKIDQDTLIEELADIFCEFAGLTTDRYKLGHAVGSHFVRFAYSAMRPFFELTEASLASISKRWKRLKDRNEQAF